MLHAPASTTPRTLVFAGSGLAGLTLALACAQRPFFRDYKIILIDRDHKTANDRTWCFWAKADEFLPAIVFKSWDKCLFYGKDCEKTLDIAPYRYHMIRGMDFYQWAKEQLAKNPNVERIHANIRGVDADNGIVYTDQGDFQGDWVFNSAQYRMGDNTIDVDGARPFLSPAPETGHTHLLQHFKGWTIAAAQPVFDPGSMTFMDYRLEQKGETRFVYVLPFSETRALIEFTVFSPNLCAAEEYDAELHRYLSEVLKIRDFQIEETEFGVIPMTDFPLQPRGGKRLIHIGTAGGFVKASSGYAFLRTQRKIRRFVDAWEQTGTADPTLLYSSKGYLALDSIMLRVLREGKVAGRDFFSLLFKKLPAPMVFRFLDEDASLKEVFRVLSAPPTWPFMVTAIRQWRYLFHLIRSKK